MTISKAIRRRIAAMPGGRVFTAREVCPDSEALGTASRLLNRMVQSRQLRRLSNGRYYCPVKGLFGEIKPQLSDILRDFLEQDGRVSGYLTGPIAFGAMGLTTQVSTDIVIGFSRPKRAICRGGYRIRFQCQPNPITPKNIELLRILDALHCIRHIPDCTPNDACRVIGGLLRQFSPEEKQGFATLALQYAPFVRALSGALLENAEYVSTELKNSLNPLSRYILPLSPTVLPNMEHWRIKNGTA